MNICEAIEIIEDFKAMDDWTIVYCPPMHEALDVVVNEALRKQKLTWIPCSERLPDKYGQYLTTHACFLAYEVRTNVWVNRDPSYWLFGEGPVIAWMEMPKPYKEAED